MSTRRLLCSPTPSTLPVGDAMDSGMGYLLSKLFGDHCVNQLVRPTRIPPRQSGAAKAV